MQKFIELTSSTNGRWFLLSVESIESLSHVKDNYEKREGCEIKTSGGNTYSVKETMTQILKSILELRKRQINAQQMKGGD